MAHKASLWLSAALAMVSAAAPGPRIAVAQNPTVEGCRVKLQDDVKLGAREPGVLVELKVQEGAAVRKGDVIGRIDDSEAKIQKVAAEWALKAAVKKARDDVQQRYAEVSAEVAQKAYQMVLDANRATPGSVSKTEEDQKYLEWQASKLSAEKAKLEQELAVYDSHMKRAEYDAANLAMDRRLVRAEFDGVVVMTPRNLYRQQGEWVGPGDPIVRLIRMDTMLVEGAIEQAKYDAHELLGCDVTVEVDMARGRKEQLTGRIVYVSPMVRLDGRYIVRAQVANREEYGQWLLRDGMTANMTIHLGTGGAAPVGVSLAP